MRLESCNRSRWLPYPEFVESFACEEPYDIHDTNFGPQISAGWVHLADRVMGVPLSSDGAATRRHELAHVRWSPQKLPKVEFSPLILLSVEDARINLALRSAQMPLEHSASMVRRALQLAQRDLETGEHAVFILRAIAGLGADLAHKLLKAAEVTAPRTYAVGSALIAEVEAKLENARRRTESKAVASASAAVRIARLVAEQLEQASMPIGGRGLASYLLHGGCCAAGRGLLRAGGLRVRGGYLGPSERRRVSKMLIAEPRLTLQCPAPRTALGDRRGAREGAIVRYANRWYSDRAIFGVRRRNRGGSVCIDTSSSMRLDAAGVDLIMKGAPGATLVAIYSGGETHGELRIVARNGRRVDVDQLTPFGNDNLVDLEALEWLARQPAPRVWVSDGLVTGSRAGCARLVGRKCRDVCLRYGIRRVMTAADAAAVLEGRPVETLPIIP